MFLKDKKSFVALKDARSCSTTHIEVHRLASQKVELSLPQLNINLSVLSRCSIIKFSTSVG
jgi:hypothetical protein